ncbi:TPA: prolipoprotein diacylglyceryl transferase [Candidatus Sumerlaeota bacterium]|jgi:phosphatidylglycerol---prolipoprotein diacylglyceryl transferase|nr:prolipoprotein diacylglyceryl transferase [Candidatus Sumerlaeota bacterium]
MHPILFTVGSFFVGTYGLMIAIGMVLGTILAIWRASKQGVEAQVIMDLIFWSVIAGVVGARAAYVVVNWKESLANPMDIIFSRTNFVFLGGVILAIPVGYGFVRWQKVGFLKIGDIIAPSIALGHAFGRMGCFSAGCCWGKVIGPDSPFAFLGVRFPSVMFQGKDISMPLGSHIEEHLIPPDSVLSLPIWPVQLIESGGDLIIVALLLFVSTRRRYEGQVFLLYLISYGILRFFTEFLRGDESRGIYFNLVSTSQMISLVGIAVGIAFYLCFLMNKPSATLTVPLVKEPVVRRGPAKIVKK